MRPVLSLVTAVIVSLNASATHAATVVDQSNLVDVSAGPLTYSSFGFTGTPGQLQSFTAGLTGRLDRIDLQLARNASAPLDRGLSVTLYSGDPFGSRSFAQIATLRYRLRDLPTAAGVQSGQFLSIDLAAQDLAVRAGSTYSIQVEAGPGMGFAAQFAHGYRLNTPDFQIAGLAYPGGRAALLTNNGYSPVALDRGFRTWVAPVPEPASWALMLAGFGVLGAVLRRRSRLLSASV